MRVRGGMNEEDRQYQIEEVKQRTAEHRVFFVHGPPTDNPGERIPGLAGLPRWGERPDGTPQDGLEVNQVLVTPINGTCWQVDVLYQLKRRIKSEP